MCAKRQIFFILLVSFLCIALCLLVSGLVIFTMYIKSPITVYSSFFVIHPLVIFVHYSPLMVGLCSPKQFLAVVEIFRLFIIHNSLSNRSPSSLSLFASKGLIPFFLLQSAKVLIVRYNPYYISCYSSQVVRFCVTLNDICIIHS